VKEQPAGAAGRIIQINLWYPSAGGSEKMNFAAYTSLAGLELDTTGKLNALQLGIEKYFAWPASLGADKQKFVYFLEQKKPMLASAAAKWLKPGYPLVILVHGFAADFAFMAEWLSSHGYIVMQVPVKGTKTYDLDYEGKGLQSQVMDYEFALNIVREEYGITTSSVGVAGFSFGGQTAVALALRNPAIKAIVSLDGGIGSVFGSQLLSMQENYDDQKIKQPVLHLYNAKDRHTDLNWFNRTRNTDRYLVAMKNMEHGHYTSFGLLNDVVPGIMGKQVANPGDGYEAVMGITKTFMDQYLKNKKVAPSRLLASIQDQYPWIKTCVEKTELKTRGT
jgi:dienelactone hydrolase